MTGAAHKQVVIQRRNGIPLLLTLTFALGAGPASHPASRPVADANPAAALAVVIAALAAGDEQAFRSRVVIRSADGYLDAYFRRVFAAARLNVALREHDVGRTRIRVDDAWDPDDTLPSCVPAADGWKYLLDKAKQLTWSVEGEVARPVEALSLTAGYPSRMFADRAGESWVIILADPKQGWMSDSDERKDVAEQLVANANAFDAAVAKVATGELRTVRAVNELLFPSPKRRGK